MGTMRRSRLGSLSEGAGTAKAVTEGVLFGFVNSPSQKSEIFDSPLKEGAEGAMRIQHKQQFFQVTV